MIDRLLQFFLFFIFSFSEFHVSAAENFVMVPKNCLSKAISCSLKSEIDANSFSFAGGEVRLIAKSLVRRVNAYRLELVSGAVLVRASSKPIVVDTLYSKTKIVNGLALIEFNQDRVVAQNITADFEFQLKGGRESVSLPKGLFNEFGPVSESGVARSHYPRTTALSGFVEKWARFFSRNDFLIFKSDFEAFLPYWRDSLSLVGPWYLDTVNRQLAEQKEEEDRIQRLREERQKEENYYRELFKRRNQIN